MDERAKKLAKIVIEYSTLVKEGDMVRITGEEIAKEFAYEIARLAVDKGAYPIVNIKNPEFSRYFLKNSNDQQLIRLPNYLLECAEEVDVNISIAANFDPKYLEDVDSHSLALRQKANKPFKDRIVGDGKDFPGKRWTVVGFPTEGDAGAAGMGFEEYKDIVFNATNIDWSKTRAKMNEVKRIFDNAEEVHIKVPGKTDLKFTLKGRGGEICDGKMNMPDGEVYYGPVEDSLNGYITFIHPAIRGGNEVKCIRLEFKDGKIVKAEAEENEQFLKSMLELKGARRIGEFGIGCNYGIKRYMKNLLFDEKIGGTIHLAIGDSYKRDLDDGGGLNNSEIHWDIVCDLRKTEKNPEGGEMYVNGKLVQKDGEWCF